jgi:amidase
LERENSHRQISFRALAWGEGSRQVGSASILKALSATGCCSFVLDHQELKLRIYRRASWPGLAENGSWNIGQLKTSEEADPICNIATDGRALQDGGMDARLISAYPSRNAAECANPSWIPRLKACGGVFRGSILLGLASMVALSGCSLLKVHSEHAVEHHAFIEYWPPPEGSKGLRLAVKDNIDMKGIVTTAGSEYFAENHAPAEKDAPCLAIARQRGVRIVGKTNLSEFAVAPSGYNEYYGTPKSPISHFRRLIPGGSSCGSAVAVARGLADVSFGTDTAGSVRVPAACCGIVGLKTTHGLISIEGVYPIEPKHLDTVGPIGKDIASTEQGMELLESGFASKYAAAMAAKPSAPSIRVGRLRLKGTDSKIDLAVDDALARAGFQVVPLDDEFRQQWGQATSDGNTLAAVGAWLTDRPYLFKSTIAGRTKAAILLGRLSYPRRYRKALARREEWQDALRRVFEKVDFIALPTLQAPPPAIPPNLGLGILEALVLKLQNTVAVNFAGNPALAAPIPLRHDTVHLTSLQLVGPPQSEAELLNAGRFVEASVKK